MENFPLSDEMIELIADARKEMDISNAKVVGALNLFIKQHKLAGLWRVAANGREIEQQSSDVPERKENS